jgi:hypothetical protein
MRKWLRWGTQNAHATMIQTRRMTTRNAEEGTTEDNLATATMQEEEATIGVVNTYNIEAMRVRKEIWGVRNICECR